MRAALVRRCPFETPGAHASPWTTGPHRSSQWRAPSRRCTREVPAMSKARLIITAAVVEGRHKSEVARDYDISRQWVHHLVKRSAAEGDAACQPRPRRPAHQPPRRPHARSNTRSSGSVTSGPGWDSTPARTRSDLARRTLRSSASSRTKATPGPPRLAPVPNHHSWASLGHRGKRLYGAPAVRKLATAAAPADPRNPGLNRVSPSSRHGTRLGRFGLENLVPRSGQSLVDIRWPEGQPGVQGA
jgi:hypothetical protein